MINYIINFRAWQARLETDLWVRPPITVVYEYWQPSELMRFVSPHAEVIRKFSCTAKEMPFEYHRATWRKIYKHRRKINVSHFYNYWYANDY